MADYFAETDPLTGQPKKKPATQLGYQDPNSQQPVQLSKEAMSGGATQQQQPQQPQAATQGGEQVLQAAQNQVLQQGQQPTQLQQATQQAAQQLVQDPMQGYDPAKTKQGLLEKAGVDRANMLEALRREYGGASGSGLLQKNMLENALSSGVDLRNYESQLDTENYNRMLDAITRSISTGQSVGQQQEDIFSQRLGNLSTVRGMGEGERAAEQAQRNQLNILGQQQEYSLETMTEQQKNDLAKMAAANGYDINTMNQQQINDLAKMAVSQGYNLQTIEQQQQNTVELQRLGFDQQTQLNAQQFGYDLTKLETANDFQAMSQDVDNKLKLAMQANDAASAEKLTILKGQIDAAAQVKAQENAIELQNLGYSQQVQLMAQQQGYDLIKLDKTFGNEMSKLIAATNLDTQSKSTLMELQGKIDTNQLLTQQDFTAIQNDLDRQASVAAQDKDIAAEENITKLRGEIDAKAQEAQNNFVDTQRVATQAWQTGERISTEDFSKATQYYDWAMKNAQQTNDIEAQKTIETMRSNTQLAMQTNEMSQEEKMAYLQNQFREAAANNDTTRQKDILAFTYAQDLSKMEKETSLQYATDMVRYNIDKALNEGNYAHAEAMQQTLLQSQSKEAALNRTVDMAQLQLQERGVDLTAKNAEWEKLKEGVAAGSVNPEVLYEYLDEVADSAGVTIEPVDTLAVYKEAQQQYSSLQQQFGLSNPNYVKNATTGELTDEGKVAFNQYYNESVFGSSTITATENAVVPTQNDISKGVTPKMSNNGVRSLSVSNEVKTKLNSLIGKNITAQGLTGKVSNISYNPTTIELVLDMPDGSKQRATIYQSDKSRAEMYFS